MVKKAECFKLHMTGLKETHLTVLKFSPRLEVYEK